MRITSWEVDLPAESVIGLEPLNCPRTPCSTGMGGPRAAWSWSSPSGVQEAAWGGRGMGDTQLTELGFCNLFPTACAYESSTSTLPHNPPVT